MRTEIDISQTSGFQAVQPAKSLIAKMAEHPFLKGMKPEHLHALADCAMEVEFKPGEWIFREGDLANRFYLIERGRVNIGAGIQNHDPIHLQTLGPGDVLGWSWLFPPYYWHFGARAASPVKAIFLYGTRLRERCEQDHDLGYELRNRTPEVVIKRLEAAQRYLVQLA